VYWCWLWDINHHIHKDDRTNIMNNFKEILFSRSENKTFNKYNEFSILYYNKYPQLKRYAEQLWNRREDWAIMYRLDMLIRGNHTQNYVEKSIENLKDIMFN
jgi:hypothetical protein